MLYRTARHLAEIYEIEELSAAEESAVDASDIEEMGSARVLIQLHTVAAEQLSLAN